MTKKDLRIVYMGTPDFAVAPLKQLIENDFNVVGVITVADKPAGRGQKIRQSPVKIYAEKQGLKVLQPINLKAPDFIDDLKALDPTLQIVVAFRMLPEIVWSLPEKGTFNLHASLLPQYRGAAPINWAIINGEKETGVTTFFIEKKIDTGAILLQRKTRIEPYDTAGSLHDKLMISGAELVAETCTQIIDGNLQSILQSNLVSDSSELKPAPKIFKPDCKIDWNQSNNKVYNFIRGLSPYPCAYSSITIADGKERSIKVFECKIYDGSGEPGNITSFDGKLVAYTLDGALELTEIQ
ncbi:MAG: methionyl-tRNA formyltransferase, partial [Bacteroidetes bacterium]